jgi:hypothetical protein
MYRFDVENGKMIQNKDGMFIMLFEHENIINRLHETFNLKDVKFKEPDILCIAQQENKYEVLKYSNLKNKEDNINNLFVSKKEHDEIMEIIEKQIFVEKDIQKN